MTKDELMALVTRYTEACDDMGAGLFNQTAAQTAARHATAQALWAQIGAEVTRLHTMAGAGPDLLDALQTLMRVHDEPAGFVGKYGRSLTAAVEAQRIKVDHATEYARAAINKATGATR